MGWGGVWGSIDTLGLPLENSGFYLFYVQGLSLLMRTVGTFTVRVRHFTTVRTFCIWERFIDVVSGHCWLIA